MEQETTTLAKLPQKRYFRQRAHANVFSDHMLNYPCNPASMNWQEHYPALADTPDFDNENRVSFADVGCGYGGLLISLAPLFPKTMMLGLEIRNKVCDYVDQRIRALRLQHTGSYQNVSVMRSNAMKFLPNIFERGQLTKMFFLFPDPHFKTKKHKARIITPQLLSEYAYFLKIGGYLYTATDVEALHIWMVEHLDAHPLFERIPNETLADDEIVKHVLTSTEEGIKVARNSGQKFFAVYRRVMDPVEEQDFIHESS